jgi:two-component system response regulator RegA
MTRVLLVDDSEPNRLTLGSLLEDEGHEVDLAASMNEGRAALQRPGAAYDLVLLDLHLGDGLGTKLLPVVRERLPGARVLLISGSIEDHELPRGPAFDGVLDKGRSFDDLVRLMKDVLSREAAR